MKIKKNLKLQTLFYCFLNDIRRPVTHLAQTLRVVKTFKYRMLSRWGALKCLRAQWLSVGQPPPPPAQICICGHNPPHEFCDIYIIPPPLRTHKHNLYSIKASKKIYYNSLKKKTFRNAITVSNGSDSVQGQGLWVLIWVQTVCEGYQVSKVTTWRQGVSKIHLDYYMKIVVHY